MLNLKNDTGYHLHEYFLCSTFYICLGHGYKYLISSHIGILHP